MTHHKPDHPIHDLIQKRWSPRAMSGDPISDGEFYSLFEAARWAPSSYNNQPWRFIYARRNTPFFSRFLDLLIEFNQTWAVQAGLLGLIAAHTTFEKNGKPSVTHAFDTGAAWENLSLQGVSLGLVVHGMEGFDYEKAREVLMIPTEYEVLAMFAVGRPAPIETLSPELQKREIAPSPRKKLEEWVMEGQFRGS